MRASDLTEDHIGQTFLVPCTTGTGKRRILFEGFTRSPAEMATADGGPFWMILKVPPSTAGAMFFRTPAGKVFAGVLARSNSTIWPVSVDYAVTEEGEIVELGVRAG